MSGTFLQCKLWNTALFGFLTLDEMLPQWYIRPYSSTVITSQCMGQVSTDMPASLAITDSRTSAKYQLPIRNNAIRATDLKKAGLGVHDPGLQNTSVVTTGISVSYVSSSSLVGELTVWFRHHESGQLWFRGYRLDQVWGNDFEYMLHLLVWGVSPSPQRSKELSRRLAREMLNVPDAVFNSIRALP